jgi:beta-glucosidase
VPCDSFRDTILIIHVVGRNAESFGPDPYLNGLAFAQAVTAMTSQGIIAGGKHFLLNEQEANREYQSGGGMGGGGMGGGDMGGDGSSNGSASMSATSVVSPATATSSAASATSTSLTSSSSLGASYNSIVDDKALHEVRVRFARLVFST